jgi:hypothetical protein
VSSRISIGLAILFVLSDSIIGEEETLPGDGEELLFWLAISDLIVLSRISVELCEGLDGRDDKFGGEVTGLPVIWVDGLGGVGDRFGWEDFTDSEVEEEDTDEGSGAGRERSLTGGSCVIGGEVIGDRVIRFDDSGGMGGKFGLRDSGGPEIGEGDTEI